MMAVGLPHRLAHVGDPRPLPAGHPGTLRHRARQPGDGQLGPGLERHQPSHLRRLLEAPQPRLLEDPGARCSPSGALHKVGLHLRGVVRGYEEIKTPKKMMLIHGVMDGDEMAIYNSPEMQLLMLRWYDHWLKGNDTGVMDEPPVSIFVRGADEYRLGGRLAASRAPSTASSTSTPARAARSSPSTTAGSSWEPPAEADSSFTYSLSGRGLDALLRRRHGRRSKTASSTVSAASRRSPALRWRKTCEVSGSIVLVLYASSDQTQHRLLLPPGGPGCPTRSRSRACRPGASSSRAAG